jgi:hypothetical protein
MSSSPARLPPAIGAAMFVTAAVVLVLQISLTRLLSATVTYHYAFVVLAVVMLALAASSITAYRHKVEGRSAARVATFATIAACALAAAPLVYVRVGGLGSDGLRLTLAMGLFYGVFWLCGYVVSALLDLHQDVVGRLYWTDLLGAGVGCAVAVPLLDRLPAQDAMLLGAVALAGAGVAIGTVHGGLQERRYALVALAITAATFVGARATDLSQLRFARGQDVSTVIWERWNSLARVSVADRMGGLEGIEKRDDGSLGEAEKLAQLWQAGWGMSRRYTGPTPEIRWIALDAGAGTQIVRDGYRAAEARELTFLEWDVTAAGHHLRRDAIDRSLVIGGGGGRDILTALQFGAERVDVVELNPDVVRAVEEATAEFSGGVYRQPRVSLEIGEGRSVLTRRADRYDVVQMSMVDTFAASASGALTLSENGLYTREAFELLVSKLDEDGILTISRWLSPDYWGETARTVTMLGDAMRRQGIADPEAHFALLNVEGYLDVGVSTALVSKRPFTEDERRRLRELAEAKGFDVLWPTASAEPTIGPFDVGTLLRGDEELLAHPVYDLAPATDERPFFFNFERVIGSWVAAVRAGDTRIGSPVTLQFAWTLSVLALVGLVGVVRPLRLLSERTGAALPTVPAVTYFGGIGLGFMLAEIALVQRFMVFLGHPTRGLSVVLAALLLASGIGSLLSTRVDDAGLKTWIHRCIGVIAALLLAVAFVLPPVLASSIGLPDAARLAIAAIATAPMGAALGTCFPLGIRLLARSGQARLVPVVWGVNGLLGVAGSVAGMGLAMTWGYTSVLFAAMLAYAATAWAAGRLGAVEAAVPAGAAPAPAK